MSSGVGSIRACCTPAVSNSKRKTAMSHTTRSAKSTTPPSKLNATSVPGRPNVALSTLAPLTKPSKPTFDDLPDAAYVRQSQLIPSPLPWSSATLWRKCKRGDFVPPVKLSERVTAWNVGQVRLWLAEQSAK